MDTPFGLTVKQYEVVTTVRDAPLTGVEEIFLIGAIGTSKTFAMAYTHINTAYHFANSIIPVGRKDMSEAQLTTFPVYLEALDKMGFVEGEDYSLRQALNDLRIRFANGSIIQFIGMNKSRDREWSKLKVTATMAGVDEVDDVAEDGYDTLFSRTGRRNESGAPRVIISACNPNEAWTKYKVYLPWLKRIGRLPDDIDPDSIEDLPPEKVVIEFNMEDSFLYPKGYYERFMTRPRAWIERYLKNNWNYFDDENSLFKARNLDLLTITAIKPGQKYIGVDPNAGGKDRATIVLWEGDTIVEIEVYTTDELKRLAEPDELEPFNPGAIIGRLTVEMMEREGVGARYVGGDVIGIGQGWLTYMHMKGYKVQQFRSGDAPIQTPEQKRKNIKPPYNYLRSQVLHLWSLDTENSRVFMYSDIAHLHLLKKELLLHTFDNTAKIMAVESKENIKKELGYSPDIADAAAIGYWVRMITATSGGGQSQRATVGKTFDDMYNQDRNF